MRRQSAVTVTMIVVSFVFFTFSPGILLSKKEKSKPIEENPDIAAWKRLNDLQTVSEFKVNKMGKGKSISLEFQLDTLKNILEKAGINEVVTIECIGKNGHVLADLGTYKPDTELYKSKSPVNPKLINPRTDSPRTTHFNSIPLIKNIKTDSVKARKLEKNGVYNKLIFKDAKGEVKATLQVKFSFPHKPYKTSKTKKQIQ